MKDHEGNEIPKTVYYVTCKDSFLSGWGMAEGKQNFLIFATDSEMEVAKLIGYMVSRADVEKVESRCEPPTYQLERPSKYYVQYKSREEYPLWYRGGEYEAV